MILSILIPSLKKRNTLLTCLVVNLMQQIYTLEALGEVEVLVDVDNKERTTGMKRNALLNRATGKYIVFIDDDDEVPIHYIEEILKAAACNADCMAINGLITEQRGAGTIDTQWFLSKDNDNITIKRNEKNVYLRRTNHLAPVKRRLALLAGFPDKSNAEDKWYSDRLNEHLKTEVVIERHMYHYKDSYPKEYV